MKWGQDFNTKNFFCKYQPDFTHPQPPTRPTHPLSAFPPASPQRGVCASQQARFPVIHNLPVTPVSWLPAGIHSSLQVTYISHVKIFTTAPKSNFAEVCPTPLCVMDISAGREGVCWNIVLAGVCYLRFQNKKLLLKNINWILHTPNHPQGQHTPSRHSHRPAHRGEFDNLPVTAVCWLPAGIHTSSPVIYVSHVKIFTTAPKSNFAEVCPTPLCVLDISAC